MALPIIVFSIVFRNKLSDTGAWGSIIAGIFTYIGSSFLGLLVFYNTLSMQRIKELEDKICIDIDILADEDIKNGFFVPYSEDKIDKNDFKYHHYSGENNRFSKAEFTRFNYVFFSVQNTNDHIPVRVNPISLYSVNNNRLIKSEINSVFSDMEYKTYLEFKQTKQAYFGVPNDILNNEYFKYHKYHICYLVLDCVSVKGEKLYYIVEYIFGKSLGLGQTKTLSKEEYDRLMEKKGAPITLTSYHKQLLKQ